MERKGPRAGIDNNILVYAHATWQMRAGDRVYVFIFAFDSLRKNTKLKKDSTLQIENKTQYEISRPLNLSQRSETS